MQKERFNISWFATKLLEPVYQRILLGLILAVLLVAGLHPFKFFPKNWLSWITPRGVLFHGYGEILGSAGLALENHPPSETAAPEMTLELWVTSLNQDPDVKDLLSFYVSRAREPFAVEEWDKKLVVGGIFRDTHGHRKFQRIGIDNAFVTGARRFVTLTSGSEGSKIYLEGALQKDFPGLTLERENFDGTLLLGQTASARQEWRGVIFGLAFYPKQLTTGEVAANFADWRSGDLKAVQNRTPQLAIYPFDERGGAIVHNRGSVGTDLTIPKRLRAVDPIILEVPSRSDFTDFSDVTINVLGFIPFGCLLAVYLRTTRSAKTWKAILATVLAGLLISLFIELLQVLLPSRDSSLLDVINNTLGSAIGATLGLALLPACRKLAREHSIPAPTGTG
jgi:VanZ family protein